MAKPPKDPQTTEFHYRPGVAPFGPQGIRGVNTEDDAGSLDPNELQRGDNFRFAGKGLLSRPGLFDLIALGAGLNTSNHILSLKEAPSDNPRVRLWLAAKGCFGVGVGTGSSLYHYDSAEIPAFQPYANFITGSDYQMCLGQYGDKLYGGDRSVLRELIVMTAHPGVTARTAAPSPSHPSPTLPFTGFTIRCLKEFDGKLFIGLENNAVPAASKISVWDGTVIKDDLTGIRPPLSFGIRQNKLVAGFDATAGNIRVRDAGAAPGTWNTFALAGFRSATQGNVMQEYRQHLYIASGIGDIYRFDGAALTVARTVAGTDVAGDGVTALTLHQGLMYYGWNTPTPNYLSRLGRYDPDSTANDWVDTYKDITTDEVRFIQLSSLLSYRRQIYAGGRQVWLVATKADDIKGTIVPVNNSGAPGAGFEVKQLLRFP